MLAWGVAPTAPHADEVIVTASGLPARPLDQAGNTARLEAARIAALDAAHFHTLGTALPGVWITRGTGQEHLTAIRSPVLTGPGSCGSFLVLENGIATRPAGFCNVNELFEVPNELAQAVEVIRGPGNALYGANALHGTLNVLLPPAGSRPGLTLRGAVGPDHYQRAMLRLDGGTDERAFNAGLVADHDGDFRDDAGYRQLKGHVGHRRRVGGGDLDLWLSGNVLDQDTAGFIVGENAYRDAARRTQNTNPGAYRDADSQRLSLRWRSADDDLAQWELAGALRRSRMDFLQHFLPGQPVEENGQDSVALVMRRYQALGAGHLTAGIDLDLARGFLRERQAAAEVGGALPRPGGLHYDYAVDQALGAGYMQLDVPLDTAWRLQGGARLEHLRYDYDNRMRDGNTRADGTPCLPNGCFYNRPADRRDRFTTLAPNLSLHYRHDAHSAAYLGVRRGFRPPQATELYRLQAGQSAADLEEETIDSLEAGWQWRDAQRHAALTGFLMRKRDYIFQDAERFNVGDGRSRHVGFEVDLGGRSATGWHASLVASWARHTYAFTRALPGGEWVRRGNDIDTAPRTLGSVEVGRDTATWSLAAAWVHQGRYYLGVDESTRYGGHDLFNLRGAWRPAAGWSLTLRLDNVLDTFYADRADHAFGNYRYFPGRDRQLFLGVDFTTQPR